jgi:hypothetical protein
MGRDIKAKAALNLAWDYAMDRKTKINIWYIVAALAVFMLLQSFYLASKQYPTIPYSQFETLLDRNKIDKVWIDGDCRLLTKSENVRLKLLPNEGIKRPPKN